MEKNKAYWTAMFILAFFLLTSLYLYLFNENSEYINIILIVATIIIFIGMIGSELKITQKRKAVIE